MERFKLIHLFILIQPSWLWMRCNFFRIDIFNLFEFNVIVFLDKWIKTIFNFILRSSQKILTDLRPFTTDFTVKLENFAILFLSPIFLLNFRIQLVYISLANLLSIFWAQHFGNKLPIFTILFDELHNCLVFLSRPNLMTLSQLHKSSITMKTLIFIAIIH